MNILYKDLQTLPINTIIQFVSYGGDMNYYTLVTKDFDSGVYITYWDKWGYIQEGYLWYSKTEIAPIKVIGLNKIIEV